MVILWLKAFHIIAMVAWFAGLFYLPRLFVYHTQAHDSQSNERFKVMERKLYRAISTPSMIVTVLLGLGMMHIYGWDFFVASKWLHAKLVFVIILLGFHFYCGKLVKDFAQDKNTKSELFLRAINEIPVIPLLAIVILAVVKPF